MNKSNHIFNIEHSNKNLNNEKKKANQDETRKLNNLIENSLNLIFKNESFKIAKINNPKLLVNIILNITIQKSIDNH